MYQQRSAARAHHAGSIVVGAGTDAGSLPPPLPHPVSLADSDNLPSSRLLFRIPGMNSQNSGRRRRSDVYLVIDKIDDVVYYK
jgi:hypothetical protein